MTAEVRLADHLAAQLAAAGVGHLFGVGGANIEDLFDAVHGTESIRPVVAKHEFSAVTMADGCARVTGRIGVVAATSGGGAMNLVPGLAEAYASRVPVLALVGQPPREQEGRGAFQDSSGLAGSLDALEVFRPVSRFCAKAASTHQAMDLLPRAIAAAQTDPKGPAVLLLPKDVQQGRIRTSGPPRLPVPPVPPVEPDPAVWIAAVAALQRAKQVLIIAGEGVASADARAELAEVARRLGAWVAVTPDAKDVFDNRDPHFAGVAGVMGHPNVEECLRRADLCLLVGTRLPEPARAGLERALVATPVICVDSEPAFVASASLRGQVRSSLRALADQLQPHPRPCPRHTGPVPVTPAAAPAAGVRKGTVPCPEAMAAIASALPDDGHVFADAGNTGAFAVNRLPAPRNGRFVVAMGMGGMGYTFGAGIGAALATGRRTYVLAGDGAFFMHGMEVHTAVEYGAPVTFVVFNNNAHAMCAIRERLFQGAGRTDDLFGRSDIAAGVAAAFPALRTVHARSAEELRRALRESNDTGGPAFVAVDADPYETPPFLPFLPASAASGRGAPTDGEPTPSEESTDDRGPVHVG